MSGKEFAEQHTKLTQAGKIEEAQLLLMNWTYYITHKEHIEKGLADRKEGN